MLPPPLRTLPNLPTPSPCRGLLRRPGSQNVRRPPCVHASHSQHVQKHDLLNRLLEAIVAREGRNRGKYEYATYGYCACTWTLHAESLGGDLSSLTTYDLHHSLLRRELLGAIQRIPTTPRRIRSHGIADSASTDKITLATILPAPHRYKLDYGQGLDSSFCPFQTPAAAPERSFFRFLPPLSHFRFSFGKRTDLRCTSRY